LAIVIAGGLDFIKCLLVTLSYGFIESFQLSLQTAGVKVPYPFLMMLPYLITIVILIIKRERMPQALGIPYGKEK
jgi:simple sugar transport system permease protein